MVEKTHGYANNKFLLHNNGQPCDSRAGQIPLTHRGLKWEITAHFRLSLECETCFHIYFSLSPFVT